MYYVHSYCACTYMQIIISPVQLYTLCGYEYISVAIVFTLYSREN